MTKNKGAWPTLPRTKCPLCRGCGEVRIAVASDPMRLAACPECSGCGTTVDRALISAAPALLTSLHRLYEATYGRTDLVPPLDFEHARKALDAAEGRLS